MVYEVKNKTKIDDGIILTINITMTGKEYQDYNKIDMLMKNNPDYLILRDILSNSGFSYSNDILGFTDPNMLEDCLSMIIQALNEGDLL